MSYSNVSLVSPFIDMDLDFYGAQRNVYNSKVMQILEQQGFINLNNGGEIIESKRQQGIVEYVDPLASIFHLVRSQIPHLLWTPS